MNRKAMVLSALMTAFVLVVIGGIVARVTAMPAAAAPVAEAVNQPAVVEAVTAPDNAAAPAPAASNDIGARQAARLALQAAPGAALLRWPELVDLQGQPAYEVLLDQGTLYIDAATGVVLYDGRQAPATGNTLGGEHEEHEQHEAHEHEFGDDD